MFGDDAVSRKLYFYCISRYNAFLVLLKHVIVNNTLNKYSWLAIIVTCVAIVAIREISVLIAIQLGVPSMGNIIGMVGLFFGLLVWRMTHELPVWLTEASNKILTESAYAYLPVSAGAGILLFKLGDEFTRIMLVLLVSTIVPLWAFAKLGACWLKTENPTNAHKKPQKEQG